MSDAPSEPIGLSSISGPSPPPPTEADERTKDEIKGTKRGQRLTPSERHDASVDRHITDICRDREWLKTENSRLQSELSKLQPEYERMREAYGNTLFHSGFSTASIALAGMLVSAPGYFPSSSAQILWSGIAVFVLGVIWLGLALAYGALRR